MVFLFFVFTLLSPWCAVSFFNQAWAKGKGELSYNAPTRGLIGIRADSGQESDCCMYIVMI